MSRSFVTLQKNDIIMTLNAVSSQCAHGKLSIVRKPEDQPKMFKWSKTFQKGNLSDFKFYPSK